MARVKWSGFSAAALVLAGLLVGAATSTSADEVTDSIHEALKQYEQGNHSEAVSTLEYASQLIRQERGKVLESFLPSPLEGWIGGAATSQAVSAMMFGGGLTAERPYSNVSRSVTVRIVTDSPMLQGILMMLNNPMIMTSQGGKLQRIKGQKAIIKYEPQQRTGEIQIVVGGKVLVTVEGVDVDEQDLIDYATAIDYKKLAAF